MAQIIKKNLNLEEEYEEQKSKFKTSLFICIGCFVGFLPLSALSLGILAIPIMLGFLISGVYAAIFHKKYSILESGVFGEDELSDIIKRLPDEYYGFQNASVCFEGKKSELDMIVVGPTGVFVIENKNMNGHIVGDAENSHWIQHKIGRQGGEYSKEFYSPVKQVGTHVYRLAKNMRNNGFNTYVNAAVYFSNPEATVSISGEQKTPVFSCSNDETDGLLAYIQNRQAVLSVSDINKLCAFINKL